MFVKENQIEKKKSDSIFRPPLTDLIVRSDKLGELITKIKIYWKSHVLKNYYHFDFKPLHQATKALPRYSHFESPPRIL